MSDLILPHSHNAAAEQAISEHMPDPETFRTLADIFKQIGDPSRVRIFWVLCHSEECVTNLSAIVNMTSPAVSHHLRQLRSGGLITSRRMGKEVYYRAASTKETRLLHHMIESMMEITCPVEESE